MQWVMLYFDVFLHEIPIIMFESGVKLHTHNAVSRNLVIYDNDVK